MLWLIVVNIDDPVTTQTFNNISVAVTNAEVLAATNQTYQIEDGTQNVSVTVRAKRSVLNKIKADNIKATADMKELDASDTDSNQR
ncbi:MAG: CdaR family protein [Dorea formicigenerans]